MYRGAGAAVTGRWGSIRWNLSRALAALCGAALLAAAPAAARSTCNIQIRDLNRLEATEPYDPFGSPLLIHQQFEVVHQNGPGCRFVITADDGRNGGRHLRSGQDLLRYELYADASLTTPVSMEGGPLAGTFIGQVDSRDSVARFTLFTVIPAGQLVRKGQFQDHLQVSAHELEDGVPTRLLDSQNTQVRARVRDVVLASVEIGGIPRPLAGTIGTVELGNLAFGGEGRFDLMIQGNAEFNLYLGSENNGVLRHSGGGPPIPYRIRVGGQTVDLSSARMVMLDGRSGDRYSLVVSTDRVDKALAGTYADSLYLSVEAR